MALIRRPNVSHYGCVCMKRVVRRLAALQDRFLIETCQKVSPKRGQGDVFVRKTSASAGEVSQGGFSRDTGSPGYTLVSNKYQYTKNDKDNFLKRNSQRFDKGK